MRKRGQLTIFIVVAVVIVMAIVFYYLFRADFFDRSIDGSDVIRDSMIDCMELYTKNSLYIVSFQGGFYEPPEKHFIYSPSFFPYYYYEGKSYLPTVEMVEDEMAHFVEDTIGLCFSQIEPEGFNLTYGEAKVDVTITRDGVQYVIDMPVVLNRDDVSMTLELSRFPIFHESKFLTMFESAQYFVEDQLKDPSSYCLTCVAGMAQRGDFRFYLFNVVDDVYIVMIFEKNNAPLMINFVNKYKPEDFE